MLFLVLSWSRPYIWGGGQGNFRGNGCCELLLYLTPHSSFIPFSPSFGPRKSTEARTLQLWKKIKDDHWRVQTRRHWSWRVRASSKYIGYVGLNRKHVPGFFFWRRSHQNVMKCQLKSVVVLTFMKILFCSSTVICLRFLWSLLSFCLCQVPQTIK